MTSEPVTAGWGTPVRGMLLSQDPRRRALALALVAAAVLAAVALVVVGLYRHSFEGRRQELEALAERRAATISAIVRATGGLEPALDVLQDARLQLAQAGMPEEVTLGRRAGDRLEYLIQSHNLAGRAPTSVPWSGPAGESMKRALAGETGTDVGFDYLDHPVLAAYRPVSGTPWGLVAKVPLAELRSPYWRAGAIALPVAALLAWGATALIGRIFGPKIRRLELSERRFRELARHASDVMLLLDRQARFVWVSPAVEALFGAPPAALVGAEVLEFVHAEDRARVRRALDDALAAPEQPVRLDLRVGRPGGGWRWLEAIGTNLLGLPEVGALVIDARDVSERRAAEERVAQLNRLLRTTSEASDAVVAASDERSLLEEVCRIGVGTGGYRLAWVGWRDPGQPGRLRPAASAGAAGGYLDQLEVRWDTSILGDGPAGRAIRSGAPAVCNEIETDERMAPWRARLRAIGLRSSAALPIRIGTEVAGALSVYAAEVNAFDGERLALLGSLADTLGRGVQLLRLRAEKEGVERTLRASEESARQLFNRVAVGLYRTSPAGEFLDANPALVRLLGYAGLEELWRANAADLYVDAAERARWRATLEREGEVSDWLLRLRRADGEIRLVHNSARVVRDADGKIVAYEGAAEDVTGRVQTLENLAATAADLQRTNEEMQQLADVVARELQEPLHTVVSYIGLLERRLGERLDDEPRQLLRHAARGAQRLQQLAHDLTTLAHVGARGGVHPVELEHVLDETLVELEPVLREVDARVERGPLPVVEGNAGALGRLLHHLIGNALKFRSEQPPRLRVTAERSGEAWQIAIEDNGIGVAPQDRDRIFEVFERQRRRLDYPGTGIGLALCRRIVLQHGGRIWVEPAPGGGSVFRFTLPVAAGAAAPRVEALR